MLERKNSAKNATSVFYEEFNDLDVYVEDTAEESQKIYKEILLKVLKRSYNIETVFPVGPCSKVIKSWEKSKLVGRKRKELYVIDGDFTLLNNNLLEKIDSQFHNDLLGLYVLPKYSLENCLLDYDGLAEIVHDHDPKDDLFTIKTNLDLKGWQIENEKILLELFVYYAIAIYFNVRVKTIKYKVTDLVDSSKVSFSLCPILVKKRIDEIIREISRNKTINIQEEYAWRMKHVQSSVTPMLRFVAGKDYLFPLIKKRIISKYPSFNADNISIKIRLVKLGRFLELSDINKSIM